MMRSLRSASFVPMVQAADLWNVALDLNGSLSASLTVLNTSAGLGQLQLFAAQFELRRWAIEGAGNHFIAGFVKELLARGEAVYPICPNLTSQYRSRRGRKKNDVVDATNVAHALLANSQLPVLQSSESQRELQELSRAQRRLSEQLKSNRGALRELMEDSPVREILQKVIRTLCCSTQRVRTTASPRRISRRKHYASLSAIAHRVTGTHWNGFHFFGLKQEWKHE